MDELPGLWRTEIWHPLSVHFPITLLLIAAFFKLIALFSKKDLWHFGGSIFLLAGVLSAWISIYTGNLADGAVSRTLCDPTVLKDHQNAAYIMTGIFSGAAIADTLLWTSFLRVKQIFFMKIIVLLMFAGSAALIYTGHLGITLVYQQGAGVYKPSADCSEFNED